MYPTPLVRMLQIGIRIEQILVLVHLRRESADELAYRLFPAARRLKSHSADADVAGHHALAGELFQNTQDLFALAEAVKENAHRADIQRMRAEPDQVAVEPRKLRHHDTQPLRALRNFDLQQLFDRQAVNQIVREIRQVVDAIGQSQRLRPSQRFALLFDARVQKADVGSGGTDRLAFQFQHNAQHAMGRGMLRPHVQRHAPWRRGRRR